MKYTIRILAALILFALALPVGGCNSIERSLSGTFERVLADGSSIVEYTFENGSFTYRRDYVYLSEGSGTYTISGSTVTCVFTEYEDYERNEKDPVTFTVEYKNGEPVLTDESGDRYYKKMDDTEEPAVTSITKESDAIKAAQQSPLTEQAIAAETGLKYHTHPSYTTCTATKNSDNIWTVRLNGGIDGYENERRRPHFHVNFFALVTVTEKGEVDVSYVRKLA